MLLVRCGCKRTDRNSLTPHIWRFSSLVKSFQVFRRVFHLTLLLNCHSWLLSTSQVTPGPPLPLPPRRPRHRRVVSPATAFSRANTAARCVHEAVIHPCLLFSNWLTGLRFVPLDESVFAGYIVEWGFQCRCDLLGKVFSTKQSCGAFFGGL